MSAPAVSAPRDGVDGAAPSTTDGGAHATGAQSAATAPSALQTGDLWPRSNTPSLDRVLLPAADVAGDGPVPPDEPSATTFSAVIDALLASEPEAMAETFDWSDPHPSPEMARPVDDSVVLDAAGVARTSDPDVTPLLDADVESPDARTPSCEAAAAPNARGVESTCDWPVAATADPGPDATLDPIAAATEEVLPDSTEASTEAPDHAVTAASAVETSEPTSEPTVEATPQVEAGPTPESFESASEADDSWACTIEEDAWWVADDELDAPFVDEDAWDDVVEPARPDAGVEDFFERMTAESTPEGVDAWPNEMSSTSEIGDGDERAHAGTADGALAWVCVPSLDRAASDVTPDDPPSAEVCVEETGEDPSTVDEPALASISDSVAEVGPDDTEPPSSDAGTEAATTVADAADAAAAAAAAAASAVEREPEAVVFVDLAAPAHAALEADTQRAESEPAQREAAWPGMCDNHFAAGDSADRVTVPREIDGAVEAAVEAAYGQEPRREPAGEGTPDGAIETLDARAESLEPQPEARAVAPEPIPGPDTLLEVGIPGPIDAPFDDEQPQGVTPGAEPVAADDARESDVSRPAAQLHVVEILEAVARRVRAGEIVVASGAEASPEAVLASVLASLLASRP